MSGPCNLTSLVQGRLGEARSLILHTGRTPRWKLWLGMRNNVITNNAVRFLRGPVGDENIDLNVTQV